MFVTLPGTTLVSSPGRYRGNKRANNGDIGLPSRGTISEPSKGAAGFLCQHAPQSPAELWKILGRRIKGIKATGENIAIIPVNIVPPVSAAVGSLPSERRLKGEQKRCGEFVQKLSAASEARFCTASPQLM